MLVGVKLNLIITSTFSFLGLIIFKIFWLRKGRTKIPNLEKKEYLKNSKNNIEEKGLYHFYRTISALITHRDTITLIDRFGFENYFFIEYHRYHMISFFFSSLFVLIFLIISTWASGFNWKYFVKEVVEIDKIKVERNTLDVSLIMIIISCCLTWGNFKIAKCIQETTQVKFQKTCKDKKDSYFFSFRSCLFTAKYCKNLGESEMVKFLEKAQVGAKVPSRLLMCCSLKDFRKEGAVLREIDNIKIFYSTWVFQVYRGLFGRW